MDCRVDTPSTSGASWDGCHVTIIAARLVDGPRIKPNPVSFIYMLNNHACTELVFKHVISLINAGIKMQIYLPSGPKCISTGI